MFTISYGSAMLLSILSGLLWDWTAQPFAAFVPIAVSAVLVVALSSTVRAARAA
jgi:CP family cyanate transporter-like MFS transporter